MGPIELANDICDLTLLHTFVETNQLVKLFSMCGDVHSFPLGVWIRCVGSVVAVDYARARCRMARLKFRDHKIMGDTISPKEVLGHALPKLLNSHVLKCIKICLAFK